MNGFACKHPDVRAQCDAGWCRIPAGCFIMGSPETEWGRGMYTEEQTPVTLTHSFMIQQHVVTQQEWTVAGYNNPSGASSFGTDCLELNCPVGHVNWYETLAYANQLSRLHSPSLKPCYDLRSCNGNIGTDFSCAAVGLTADTAYECEGFRLPTEAEWEYAARAGTRTAFYGGDIMPQKDTGSCYEEPNLDSIAWYCLNSNGSTHAVGQKFQNSWGLYDMLGNAGGWVQDDVSDWTNIGARPTVDPSGKLSFLSLSRVTKGGYWNSWSPNLRAAARLSGTPDARGTGLGFRLVRSILDGPQVDAVDSGDGG